ncbi:MAG: gliding motility-associated C-terminal domain-containing protein [Cyclobacteriaceae bacterium]
MLGMKRSVFAIFVSLMAFNANAACPTAGATVIEVCNDISGNGTIRAFFYDGTPPSSYILFSLSPPGPVSDPFGPVLVNTAIPLPPGAIAGVEFTLVPDGDYIIRVNCTPAGFVNIGGLGINVDSSLAPDVTISPAGPFCVTDASVNLTAATGGGSWSGTGITNPATGTFDPATAGPGSHLITYTLVSGPCTYVDTETIQVDAVPDATITPAGPFCETDASTTLVAATGGGTWSGTGITNPATGAFDPATAGVGSHLITYTLTVGACTSVDTETIQVDAAPDATITPAGPFCETDASTTLVAATGGGTWSGTGITNPATGAFDPATAGPGSHLITYTLTIGACTSVDTETIQVDAAPDVTITPAGPFCVTDPSTTLVAATGGGTWSGTGITNPATGAFDPATAGVGSHLITYTLTVGACTSVDTETIQVDAVPDATITPAGPFCETDASVNLVAATGGGTWSGTGITNPATGAFDPATAGPGSHLITYTLTIGACTSVDTETIQVDAAPDATITPAGPFCETDASTTLVVATGGGTWSGTGITNPATGAFDPAIAGPGSHLITYTLTIGACTSVDTETIQVDAVPDATITPAGPFCETDASVNLVAATGGGTWSGTGITNPATGAFDPATAGPGSHLITYTLTVGACTSVDTETIQVDAAPDATITPAGPFCETDASVNLVAATGGGTWSGTGITNPATGAFDPATAGPGSHLITYTLTIGACTSVDTETIQVDAVPDATIAPAGPFCETDASTTLVAATGGGTWSGTGITNPATGAFDPATAGVGSHLITYTLTVGACTSVDTETIQVDAAPDATITPAGPFCETDASVNLVAATGGGTWSGTGITNPATGAFDPAIAGPGSHLITYTLTIGACTSVDTETIQVDAVPDATITPAGPFCETDASVNLVAATGGGTWSGTGITNPATGAFDPATAGPGSHLITYTLTVGACTSVDTETIQVDAVPDATITPAGPFCETDASVNLVAATGGGTWSGTGITNPATGAFDPATAGPGSHLITYTLTIGACTSVDTETIQVDAAPDATITPAGPFCETDASTTLVAATGGGTWSGTGITNPATGAFDPAIAGPGSHLITYTLTIGACTSVDTETIQVDAVPDATITPAGPFCETDASVNLVAATGGGTWSGTGITNPATGAFDPATAGPGSHLITYTLTIGACTSVDTETIQVDAAPDATITPAGPFCETDASVNLVAATGGGTWSGTGITNPATGAFDPATAGPGSHLITYTLTIGACTSVDTETIQVDAVPDATITPAGPFCETDASTTLVAATGGGTWSGTGITNPATGAFDPATAGPGSHLITYTLTVGACTSVDTETIQVDSAPDATITPAGPFCESDASVNLVAATGGGTWSGTGITNPATGAFDPATAGPGSHLITYTITAGACTSIDTETILVNQLPTTSNAGPDQNNVCGTISLAGNVPAVGTALWSFAPGGNADGLGSILTPASATSGFNGTPGQTYTLRWTISNGTCAPSTDDVQIQFDPSGVTPSAAGPDQALCASGNFTLAANAPAVGTGVWSIVGAANGATITDVNVNNTTVTGLNAGASVTLRWTITNGPCVSTDDVVLTHDQNPSVADAGTDQSVCSANATLAAAVPAVGTGLWSIISGAGGSVATPTANNSAFTGVQGNIYVLRWTVSNGTCTASTDEVTITMDLDPTTSNAGPDQLNVCGTVTLAANSPVVGSGTWSFAVGGNPDGLGAIADVNDPASNFNGSPGVTYVLTWTISNGSCTASTDDVQIQYDPLGVTPSNAGTDQNICGTSTALAANNPTLGTGQWSFAAGGNPDGLGVIADVNNQASNFSGSIGQVYTLQWTITNLACVSTDQVVVSFNTAPTTSNAGTDQSICGTAATLAGNNPSSGTGQWSFAAGGNPDGLGAIADVNNRTSGFTGTAGQVYVLTWTISSGGCTPSQDDVQITFNAGTLDVFNTNYCENAGPVDLSGFVAATPAGGTLTFTGTQVTGSNLDPAGLSGVQTIAVSYVIGACTINKNLLVNILAPTNPSCTGAGGGGGTGTCATVAIVPMPSPATCTLSNGSVVMDIVPAVPAVNNTGVRIDIVGISSTNMTINRTNFFNPSLPNSNRFDNLPLGTYSYTVEYGDPSCIKTGQFTVDQSGTVGVPTATNIQSPACFGQLTGSLVLDVPGETGNLLEWSLDGISWNPFTAGNTITGLPASATDIVISVRRSSSDPCNAAVTVNIPEVATDIQTTLTASNATCANNDGSVLVGPITGGAAPYTFRFDGNVFASLPPANTFTNVAAGAHVFTVVDANNCSKDFIANVSIPGLVSISAATTPPDCSSNGTNGAISVTVNSVGAFQVGISNDQFTPPATFQNVVSDGTTAVNFGNLSAGTYFVTAQTTSSQCPNVVPMTIVGGPVLVDFTLAATDNVCFGNAGGVTLSAIRGSSSENYSYEIVQSGNVVLSGTITPVAALSDVLITGLAKGSYQVRLLQDQSASSGCTSPVTSVFKSFAVAGPDAALDTLFVNKTISLPDLPTGSLLVGIQESLQEPYEVRLELTTPLFPTQNFLMDWTVAQRNTQNLSVEMTIANLYAGAYTLSLRDALGCEKQYPVTIDFSTEIDIPNIFTPNGDGVNDVFYIRNLPTDAQIIVSNRWGKEVFASNSYQNDWDGGETVDGVYYYRISAGGQAYTGWVEIMRGK